MFQVLFKNQVKLIVQQSLYWGTALFVIVFAVVFYNLYFVDQATSFWDGETSPPARYVIIYLGGVPLALMMLVSCFLSTRTYAKESQFKIKEVLFTKPFGNLVHALSSTAASTLLCALPIIGFVLIVFLVFAAQGWFNADVAEPFEPVSTCVFIVFTTIVSLNFASLLSYYLYYVIRVTILSVLASTAIVLGAIYLLTRVSYSQFVFFEFLPLVGDIASDMIVDKLEILDYIRFVAFMCLCATLTGGATWVIARRDQLEKMRVLLSGYFGVITCVGFSILFLSWFSQSSNTETWRQQLLTYGDGITLDLQKVSGSVLLAPGKNFEAEITINGTLDENSTVNDQLLFWLNPGFSVQMVQIDDREAQFKFDAGKLSVSLNHEKTIGEQVELTIEYRGRPNTRYGYQDSSLDVLNIPYWDQLITYYGVSPGIFDRKYVALLHSTHWLPTSPIQKRNGAGSIDFVEADLSITVPVDWFVTLAGNTTVQELNITDDQIRTFHIVSQHPLTGFNLVASDMTKYSEDLETVAVTLELYVSDLHVRRFQTIENYKKYVQVFKSWFIDSLKSAQEQGYIFPCDTYRLIAVPSDLRLYGGGTFMDSLLTLPCTFLIREHGPIATNIRPMVFFRGEDFDYTPMYRSEIEMYFDTRHNGGNPALDLTKHYFEFQTGFLGSEGNFLKIVMSYLNNFVMGKIPSPSPYSPSVFFPRAMNMTRMTPTAELRAELNRTFMNETEIQWVINTEITLRKTLADYVKRYTRHIDQTDIVFEHFLESDTVVNVAAQNSLQELATSELTPLQQEAIRWRSMALAEKMFTMLGHENSRLLLKEISNKFQYQNVSLAEILEIADVLNLPVREVVVGWFEQTEQFHFSFSPAIARESVNPDTDESFYQISFSVKNAGRTAGVFRTSLRVDPEPLESTPALNSDDRRNFWHTNVVNARSRRGPTILIPAGETKEVGIVSTTKPFRVKLTSYDASHVNDIRLSVRSDPFGSESSERAPFEGTRPSNWTPQPTPGVVIDDIDLPVQPPDDGLMTYNKSVERFDYGGSWGHTRKSFIYTEDLKKAKVNFEAQVPASGLWEIMFHVPDIRGAHSVGYRQKRMMVSTRADFKGRFDGKYETTIKYDGREIKLEFDVALNDYGWVQIGSAELSAGSIDVSIVPKTGTEQIFFDALRLVRPNDDH